MTSQDWFEDLNHGLETWLDAWLAHHPGQGALLEEEDRSQARSVGTNNALRLRQEARKLRQVLLQQGEAVQVWRQRYQEALASHNYTLARQCADHERICRQDGQVMWERLETIGSLRPEEWQTTAARGGWRVTEAPASLEQAWSNFVVERELRELQRQGDQP
ncbi:MAG: hypothetical protein TQ37_02335 [Candidatus Synechococcus spongiarum 15L]|uniref:Uncharacterized protein n=1 Tax=Candidatus Synechococcus spongiarum 15L TaxID=1608419 RepID=A0A0G8AY56_9SYNE|nr:MAG: hypothetical protein TQ37_02335 [Candidatus Synechococcus spongiarum 15L]MCY4359362.1 hypothetical protein [Cyanobacteria bacterium MAG APA_bin_95]